MQSNIKAEVFEGWRKNRSLIFVLGYQSRQRFPVTLHASDQYSSSTHTDSVIFGEMEMSPLSNIT